MQLGLRCHDFLCHLDDGRRLIKGTYTAPLVDEHGADGDGKMSSFPTGRRGAKLDVSLHGSAMIISLMWHLSTLSFIHLVVGSSVGLHRAFRRCCAENGLALTRLCHIMFEVEIGTALSLLLSFATFHIRDIFSSYAPSLSFIKFFHT